METPGQKEASGGFKSKYSIMPAAHTQLLFSKSAVYSVSSALESGWNPRGISRPKRNPKRGDGSIRGNRVFIRPNVGGPQMAGYRDWLE